MALPERQQAITFGSLLFDLSMNEWSGSLNTWISSTVPVYLSFSCKNIDAKRCVVSSDWAYVTASPIPYECDILADYLELGHYSPLFRLKGE